MHEAFDSLYHQNWIEGQYLRELVGTRGPNGVHQGARGGPEVPRFGRNYVPPKSCVSRWKLSK